MRDMRVPVIVVFCLCSIMAPALDTLADQSPVFSNESVRVFALDLPSGRSIKLTARDHNYFLVTLKDGILASARQGFDPIINVTLQQGDGRVLYGGRPLTVVNKGGTYHGILVEFLDPAVSTYDYQWRTNDWDWGQTAFSPPIADRATFVNSLFLNRAIAWQVQLLPGDALPPASKGPDYLLVPVTDLELRGDSPLRLASGEVRWFTAGARPKLVNESGMVAKFIVLNFGRDIDMPTVIPTVK
jgi:hypothetical protein